MHKHTRFCQRKTRPQLSFFSRTNTSLTIVKERCFNGTHKKPSSCTKYLLLQLVLPQFQKPLLQASNMNTVSHKCAYILPILNVTGSSCNYLSYQFQPLQGTCNFFYMNSTIQQTSIRCNDTFDFLT